MLKTRDIIFNLKDEQAQTISTILANDLTYSEITLQIFEAYRVGISEDVVAKNLKLDLKAFKVFERIIYRTLLNFYQIEDSTYKDLILTSVFYALHGGSSKSKNEKRKELEDLFQQMKKFQVEQASVELLAQLVELQKATPLEAVYQHLHNKYQFEAEIRNQIISELIELNQLISQNNLNSLSSSKSAIKIYKRIRVLAHKTECRTAKTLLNASKLSLVIIGGQTQLLKETRQTTAELFKEFKNQYMNLPFGILKYSLENIWKFNMVAFYSQQGDFKKANTEYQKLKERDLNAFNLGLDGAKIINPFKDQITLKGKPARYVNLIPQNFQGIHFNPIYYDGNRLSCS